MGYLLSHEFIGIITVVLAIGLHIPYFFDALKNKIQPHPFTWILWTMLTFIIFFAQLFEGAGPGSWGTGAVAVICLGILFTSIKNGFDNIKKADVILFSLGLAAIPLWIITEDATLSVIIVTIIDLLAFAPTFRKSYLQPYGEPLYLYISNFIRHGLSLFAIVNISIATALFPFMVMLANIALTLFLIWRRKVLKP